MMVVTEGAMLADVDHVCYGGRGDGRIRCFTCGRMARDRREVSEPPPVPAADQHIALPYLVWADAPGHLTDRQIAHRAQMLRHLRTGPR